MKFKRDQSIKVLLKLINIFNKCRIFLDGEVVNAEEVNICIYQYIYLITSNCGLFPV